LCRRYVTIDLLFKTQKGLWNLWLTIWQNRHFSRKDAATTNSPIACLSISLSNLTLVADSHNKQNSGNAWIICSVMPVFYFWNWVFCACVCVCLRERTGWFPMEPGVFSLPSVFILAVGSPCSRCSGEHVDFPDSAVTFRLSTISSWKSLWYLSSAQTSCKVSIFEVQKCLFV
jgi:hypothetical protein